MLTLLENSGCILSKFYAYDELMIDLRVYKVMKYFKQVTLT